MSTLLQLVPKEELALFTEFCRQCEDEKHVTMSADQINMLIDFGLVCYMAYKTWKVTILGMYLLEEIQVAS